MKIQFKINNYGQYWFGPQNIIYQWEKRIVINHWEFDDGILKVPDNHLKKTYKNVARRLGLKVVE